MSAGYTEFELDLTRALLEHLPPIFGGLTAASLNTAAVNALPERAQGVYMLLQDGVPMYIGKTDAEHGFRNRLQRHLYTLTSRRNLNISRISFKAVRVMVFTTVNVEATLIKHFIGKSEAAWQNSGFGSNDPGHNREYQAPSDFDIAYPINIDLPLNCISTGAHRALAVLISLKKSLPYDLRYMTDRGAKHGKGHIDQRDTIIDVPRDDMTLRELIEESFLPAMPDGWVFNVFPGRVIFYKEPTIYPCALERFERRA